MVEVIDWGLPANTGPVTNAVRAGDQVYTVQIPRDPETGRVQSSGDISERTRRALANLVLVMRQAGGTLKDVAQITVFLVEASDAEGMNEVYRTFFEPPYPNRATVIVKELLVPGMRIEMVVHAHLDRAT